MLEVIANSSIGKFVLGNNIEEYINKNSNYRSFKRVSHIQYQFIDTGVILRCDDQNIIKEILISPPNKVYYSGIKLMGNRFEREISKVIKELDTRNIQYKKIDVGVYIEAAGICLIDYEGYVHDVELCGTPNPSSKMA